MEESNESNDFKEFKDFNKHYNDKFLDLFRLEEKHRYLPAIIALKYQINGLPFRPNIIIVNEHEFDTRFSFTISVRSGNGKKELSEVLRILAEAMEYHVAKIVSLHEEQLIGKVIPERDEIGQVTDYTENRGYFDDDVLIKDDALSFIKSPKHEEARNYFLGGWDTYGKNEVYKRLTEHTRDQALHYCPKFVSTIFLQDRKIPKENISIGIARKSPFIHIEAPDVNKDLYKSRFRQKVPRDFPYHVKILKNVKDSPELEWAFSEEAIDGIAEQAEKIRKKMEKESPEYCSMLQWVIQDYITRFSAVLAGMHAAKDAPISGRTIKVTKVIVECAAKELWIILEASLLHWNSYVIGGRKILSRWEKIVLQELQQRNATGEENAVHGTTSFAEEIADRHDICVGTVRNAMRTLRDKGKIDYRQIGKTEKGKENSKIWLVVNA